MMLTLEAALISARERLRDVTPLKGDCGRVCGRACCLPAPGSEGSPSGMYLFPGEAGLYKPCPGWARLCTAGWASGDRILLLECEGVCPREDRPLACRLFPLCARSSGGGFTVGMDPRGRSVCPLIPHGVQALDPAFTKAVTDAIRTLWAFPDFKKFLEEMDYTTLYIKKKKTQPRR